MRVAVLVPNDDVISRLAAYARSCFEAKGHEVFVVGHPPEALMGTFRARRRRVGWLLAIDEAAYSLFEGMINPWSVALQRLGLNQTPHLDFHIQDTTTGELSSLLRFNGADLLLAIGCTRIQLGGMPAGLIALNLHPGVLPRYKGVGNPEALLCGDTFNIGYTLHRLTTRIDEGDVFLRKRFLSKAELNFPVLYLATYQAAIVRMADCLEDAVSKQWPCEDDFWQSPMVVSQPPLWRLRLSCFLVVIARLLVNRVVIYFIGR